MTSTIESDIAAAALGGGLRIGVDIGGTKTHAVVLGRDGAVLEQWRGPTGTGDSAVVATAATAVESVMARLGLEPGAGASAIASIGVGVPGTVDGATGHVAHAVNLGVASLALGAALEERLARPVRVENDVNAAALGAFHLIGAPRIGRSMAYLNLGTGLAAGLVVDGALWRGSRGAAGEIGHIPVDPAGEPCPCGQRGCLETVASGSAIARLWPEGGAAPASALLAAAESGDERALAVTARVVGNIAAAVRILVLAVDVDVVVIGGGLSALGDRLLDRVRLRLAADGRASAFLGSLELDGRVLLSPRDAPVAAVGAALVGERLGRSSSAALA